MLKLLMVESKNENIEIFPPLLLLNLLKNKQVHLGGEKKKMHEILVKASR